MYIAQLQGEHFTIDATHNEVDHAGDTSGRSGAVPFSLGLYRYAMVMKKVWWALGQSLQIIDKGGYSGNVRYRSSQDSCLKSSRIAAAYSDGEDFDFKWHAASIVWSGCAVLPADWCCRSWRLCTPEW